MSEGEAKTNELRAAVAALEAQRAVLGDSVVDPAIAALRRQLEELEAPSGNPPEERKIVTILFVDVSGFTALAEKLDAEEVRSVINACFDALVPVVQKYGGTIDKFIGDEIMALFGAPAAHENDPERALRASLEMMDRISQFNLEHQTTLSLHIGVNTGPVVAGVIGSRERKDYSVMGDAVNLAARLEDASPDGQIFVGPTTYRLTSSLFDFETVRPIMLKGKTESLTIHRLMGLKQLPHPARGIAGLRSELIGREAEVAQIRNAVQALRNGDGGIIAVAGDAGVGKSRLLSESLGRLCSGLTLAEGRALSHTAGMSYWMARDLLRALLGVPANVAIEQLDRTLRNSLRTLNSLVFDEVYPYLATLLQLPLERSMEERVRFLSTEALQQRILRAFRHYLSARVADHPLVMVCEDLHWCDPSSLTLLKDVLPIASELPLLIVLAFRREEIMKELQHAATAAAAERFVLIELAPLDKRQSGALVAKLLQIAELPNEVRDLILNRAEGNPFFIEELLRSLLDSGGVIVNGGGLVVTGKLVGTQIPETVQGVIAARMDRLPLTQKETLQTGSVFGRIFQQNVLQRVVPKTIAEQLEHSLIGLCRLEFVQKRNQLMPNDEFVFKHAITQDVAYETILKARRKEIHKQVGVALETLFPDRLSELAPALGYHFERAELPDKAFRYLKSAGEHAQAVFANIEAADYFRSAAGQARAILLAGAGKEVTSDLAEVEEALGDVLRLQGRNEEARDAYRDSLNRLPNSLKVKRSMLQRKIGSAYTVDRDYQAMTNAFDAAEKELGREPTEPVADWWREKMQILLERLHLLYWQGMSTEMSGLADQYRSEIETRGTPLQRGRFFQMLGLAELTGSRYASSEKAVQLTELALSTSGDAPNLAEMAHLRFTAGLTNLFRGTLNKAIEHFEAGLALAERTGDLVTQTRCLAYLSVAVRRGHDPEATDRYGRRAAGLAAQLGMPEYVAMAKASLAWLAWQRGEYSGANSLGVEALNVWHGMSDPYGVDWQAILPLVGVAMAEHRLDDAIEYARGLFSETQHPLPPALASAARGAIEGASDKTPAEKEALIARIIKVAKDIGYL